MKEMEFTFKVTTDGPLDPEVLAEHIKGAEGIKDAVCVSFRVKPKSKAAKP